MKKMVLPFLLGLSIFSFSSALAQTGSDSPYLGPNITRTYYTDELENSYGILTMGRDELWTLTFPSPVVDVLYTKEGMVSAKIIGNSVMLAAIASSGKVPIGVILEGDRKQYFVAEFTASTGAGLRNIKITTRPAPSLQSNGQFTTPNVVTNISASQVVPPPAPAPQPQMTQPASGLVSTRTNGTSSYAIQPPGAQASTPPAGQAVPAATGYGVTPGMLQAAQAQNTTPAPAAPGAITSHLNAQFSVTFDGNMHVLYYRIQNVSSAPYALSERSLKVTSQGQPLQAQNAQDRTLMPGQWLYGTVMLQGRTSTPLLNIEWAGQQAQTNAVTTLRTSVNVQQAAIPSWQGTLPGGASR